jgi:hypothetical protein
MEEKMKNIRLSSMVALIFVVLNNPVITQTHPNSIYLELMGNGGLYSLNYDRLFTENIGARIGFMYFETEDFLFGTDIELFLIPITLNYLVGSENHKFELGIGPVIVFGSAGFFGYESVSGSGVGGTATIGYRYQPIDGGFLFRIGFTPYFGFGEFHPTGGLSVGYTF